MIPDSQGNLEIHKVRLAIIPDEDVLLLVQIDVGNTSCVKLREQLVQLFEELRIHATRQRQRLALDERMRGDMRCSRAFESHFMTDGRDAWNTLKFFQESCFASSENSPQPPQREKAEGGLAIEFTNDPLFVEVRIAGRL
jgi:hypothetical protein